jgi:hypothetical protein
MMGGEGVRLVAVVGAGDAVDTLPLTSKKIPHEPRLGFRTLRSDPGSFGPVRIEDRAAHNRIQA